MSSMPTVIAESAGTLFGISAEFVHEMITIENVVVVPNTPDFVRGAINRRGEIFSLFDLRTYFGNDSLLKEREALIDLMHEREQDHLDWLEALEKSATDGSEFTKTTDPDQCAFGKWYNNYKTEDRLLSEMLRKFDDPHRRIHAVGEEVMKYIQAGEKDKALARIEKTRGDSLAVLVDLFEQLRERILYSATSEICMILRSGSSHMALCVDKIESVEFLSEEKEELDSILMDQQHSEAIQAICRRKDSDQFVQTIDAEQLFAAIAKKKK
jgi:chemotaxis signal transduction protein